MGQVPQSFSAFQGDAFEAKNDARDSGKPPGASMPVTAGAAKVTTYPTTSHGPVTMWTESYPKAPHTEPPRAAGVAKEKVGLPMLAKSHEAPS